MKKIILLLFTLFIVTHKTFAQEQLLKKGNKVFILANDEVTKHLKETLLKWGIWQVADNRKDADFIMKFYCLKISLRGYSATAEFINPTTNETFKMTGSVYSIISSSDAAELLLYDEEQKRKN